MCADEVGSNWWPSEIQLWLLVRITTRELFNPDGPCGWVLEVAWNVLSVPGDYTTLSCTTPIAPAACGKDTNITIFRMKAFCCDMEHVGSLLGESLRLRWLLGFCPRVNVADEVGSNWWPSEIQLWLLVRIITRELFNPDGPCGWVLEVAWSVLSVPGDSTTLSCTTPIAPAACGKDTNITIFRMKAFCCDMEHVGSLLGESLRLRWSLGFCQRVYMCADEVGSNWWPSEIQLWLLVRITTRELFNPDGPCGWVLEVAWSVLSVPGDYTTLSCTTPIAPAACGKDTNITIFRMKAFCCDMEHVGSLLGESLRLRWSLGFYQRVYMCADEVGSNWWPSEIQLWLLVRIITRELFNPDGPCGWVLEVAWSVLSVPGDSTTLSCTTPIAPAACGRDMKRHQHHQLSDEGILLWQGACWVLSRVSFDLHFFF